MEEKLLLSVTVGILFLVFLIIKIKLQPFLSLLIAAIVTGLLAGMSPDTLLLTIQNGMASTLGFVATIVGLGAILGAVLERSGSATVIAQFLMQKFGVQRAPLAMLIAGFVIAIPVFFDVAFIILIPVIYALQKRTGKSLLLYAIPLLAGLAITHVFIPPTPGPVAVADIIGVPLGWVIISGVLAGIPTALISGLWFGKFIAKYIHVSVPKDLDTETKTENSLPAVSTVFSIIGLPIVLIVVKTITDAGLLHIHHPFLQQTITLLGHPFTALLIANIIAWYVLGIRRGFSRKELLSISTKSMSACGVIILLTGAGGVFKQVLIDTEIGKTIAVSLSEMGIPVLFFAFLAAAFVRILQGSSTVAMITAAGLVAPLITKDAYSAMQLAALVTAIASGASTFSHVNDSGFWLVSQYLGLSEKQTLQSWTVMITLMSIVGFLVACLIFLVG